jgi:LPXTG-site transpeptidase (sortase) family protein
LPITPKHQRPRSLMFGLFGFLAIILLLGAIALGVYGFGNTSRHFESGSPVSAENNLATNAEIKHALPTRITIPTLKIDAPIIGLDIAQDTTLEVPSNAKDVGWYKRSPVPGEKGPAILVGHLDSAVGRGVFYNLKKLRPGDNISINKSDGTTATFIVEKVEQYAENKFPTEKVYGKTDEPVLRLLTCAGTFNHKSQRYSDNLVVYAKLQNL